MAAIKEVGEVEKIPYEMQEIEWRIPDYFTVAEYEKIICLASSTFSVTGVLWHFRLWPDYGQLTVACETLRNDSNGYLPSDAHREHSVKYDFGLKKGDGTVEHLFNGVVQKNEVKNMDKYHFIEKTQLLQRKSELVPGNVLTIVCIMKWTPKVSHSIAQTESVLDNKTKAPKLIKLDTLSENFRSLFLNKESCDATLFVMDKEYKAHRTVLMARSPVFAAMFLHETSEKQTGIVNIPDCDPESFEEFLEFLYSGKLEKPSPRSALHLYEASDKYNVQELKIFCSEFLMENLTVEYLCDAVIMADKYDDTKLLSSVQCFSNKNLSSVFVTPEWNSLLNNNPRLANKLLIGMSSKVKIVE